MGMYSKYHDDGGAPFPGSDSVALAAGTPEKAVASSKWDDRFMDLARMVGSWSRDPSTTVGTVIAGPDKIVLAVGYNGFPRGCDDDPAIYQDRPRKHLRTTHSEANAVAASSRSGVSLKGATAYVTAPCCAQCAALLIQAGVMAVVVPDGVTLRSEWAESAAEAQAMFAEARVKVRTV